MVSRAPLVLSGSLTTCTRISCPGLSSWAIFCPLPPPRPRRWTSTPGIMMSSTCRKPFFSSPMSTKATLVSPRSTATSTCFFTFDVQLLDRGQLACFGELRRARLRVDRLEQPEREKGHENRRAAVAHERQGHAGDRHDPDGHADVDEDLKHQHRGDAAGDERAVQVLRRG